MKSRTTTYLPAANRIMTEFGNNLKLAHRWRRLRVEKVAERADIARTTLWQVKKGSPSVALVFI